MNIPLSQTYSVFTRIRSLTALILAFAASASLAEPVRWDLRNVTLEETDVYSGDVNYRTVAGYFVYDADTNSFTDIQIQSESGYYLWLGHTYTEVGPTNWSQPVENASSSGVTLNAATSCPTLGVCETHLLLQFVAPLSSAGGTVSLSGEEQIDNRDLGVGDIRYIVSGSVSTLPEIVEIDVDPWSAADTVDPAENNTVVIAVLGSSIVVGDAADFDVAQIDPATLTLGVDQAPNISVNPLYGDYDGDGNTDAAFAFKIRDAGIRCDDTQVTLNGALNNGSAFTATAAITTPDCLTLSSTLTVKDFYAYTRVTAAYDLNPCHEDVIGEFDDLLVELTKTDPDCEFLENWGDEFIVLGQAATSRPVANGSGVSLNNYVRAVKTPDAPYFVLGWTTSRSSLVLDVREENEFTVGVTKTGDSEASIELSDSADAVVATFAPGSATVTLQPGEYILAVVVNDNLYSTIDSSADVAIELTASSAIVAAEIDVDPWSPDNIVRPDSTANIAVGVMGSSIVSGDSFDFDVTQIDPATLKLGAGEAPNVAVAPLYGDYDSDSNSDAAFVFRTQDAGIFCDDTEVTLTGQTFTGLAFEGTDTITTTDCETTGCHP